MKTKTGWMARAAALALGATLLLSACDNKAISELEEGVSTEADVRARFGEPENVWQGAGGARVFEYNRQSAGVRNYMITIGPNGKMSALRQVLTPENFARVKPGMPMEDVRKMLGREAKRTTYPLKNQTEWDWQYLDPPSTRMLFTVVISPEQYVVSTRTGPAPATNAADKQ